MDCSMPGSPVLHYFPEFAQIHVHWIGDTIQSSHPLLPPLSPFAVNLSQHQGPFQWVGSSHQAAKAFGASASASVLPMNIQGWFPLGLTHLISLLSTLHLWIKSNVSLITWISLFIIAVKILSQVYSIKSVSQFSHWVMSDSLWLHGLQQLGLPVHHQLLEFTQTHIHWIGDTIRPSHPLNVLNVLTPIFCWWVELWSLLLFQFSSVTQLCLTIWDPMNHSTPGLPVHHQLPESTQTNVHWVSDAIQPSHPLLSPSSPAFNLSQHQGLFKWVSSSHQVAKVLEFQLQHQSFQWTPRTDFL